MCLSNFGDARRFVSMNRVLEVDDLAVFRAQTSAQTAVEHISLRSVRLTCRPTPARTDEVTHLASHAPSAHPVPVWRARANTKTRRLRARLRISYPIYTSALTQPAMKGGRRNQAPSARARSPAPPLLRPLPTATRVGPGCMFMTVGPMKKLWRGEREGKRRTCAKGL